MPGPAVVAPTAIGGAGNRRSRDRDVGVHDARERHRGPVDPVTEQNRRVLLGPTAPSARTDRSGPADRGDLHGQALVALLMLWGPSDTDSQVTWRLTVWSTPSTLSVDTGRTVEVGTTTVGRPS